MKWIHKQLGSDEGSMDMVLVVAVLGFGVSFLVNYPLGLLITGAVIGLTLTYRGLKE